MNTRRSTGSINSNNNNKINMNRFFVASFTKTITPELHAINAKICRLVEKYPCMYDRSDPSYMRKSHVERAWEDISKEMNDDVDSCKERFRNIRTSFARSINVQRGSNRIKPYYLSEELEFLKKHITPGVPVPVKGRRSRDSIRKGDDNDDYDENENDDEENPGALVHIKHSVSSDEQENDNSSDSSGWVTHEHAQSVDSQSKEKPESELASQSDEDEQKPANAVPTNSCSRVCPIPPKKRRRMVADAVPPIEPVACDVNPEAVTVTVPVVAKSAVMDFDDAFLQGLRPEMHHMNFHEKLYFKRRVYELLGEIFENRERVHSQPQANGQLTATPSPPSLQHLGLLARTGALQLPKLAPRPAKDL